MRISYQWLSEYIDLSGYTAAELAEKLTRSGVEVDGVEQRNQGLSNIVVGKVVACEQHPNADKLKLCTVDAGQAETLQIICGASNVAEGQKVPVALVGATLPNDFKIKKAKLRGVESFGMICSASELGMNDRLLSKELQEGIYVLPEEAEIGSCVIDLLGLNDEVLELDLTPNRSDCLSMIGAAYEVAAILERKVRLPQAEWPSAQSIQGESYDISINDSELCSHYSARSIQQVKLGPAPLWMQNRLVAAGIRPINNIVDITNYVMLEYGQPLHAFDASCLAERQIQVRLATPGEQITTLDGVERVLDERTLVIADAEKPIALAGVMGGANSEVTAATTEILLESACFQGDTVRRTSRKLGLRSESSLRFEKGVDPANVIPALNRAAALMAQYASGQVVESLYEAGNRKAKPVQVSIKLEEINRYLGTQIKDEEVQAIFSRLQFPCEADAGTYVIDVPSRRGDITREVDLIEEVARLYGYDHIPTTWISGKTTPGSLTRNQKLLREVRNFMTQHSLHETINYTFTHPKRTTQLPVRYDKKVSPITLSMPMSEDRSVLRTSQLPHLIDAVVYNHNRNVDDVAMFELGHVYLTEEAQLTKQPQEKLLLSGVWAGQAAPEHWSKTARKVDFFDVKGLLDALFTFLGIHDAIYEAAQPEGFHPGKTASIQLDTAAGKVEIGWIGQLHPQLQKQYELDETYMFEIELVPLFAEASLDIAYQPLPRYPSIGRDLAMVVAADVPAGEMVKQLQVDAGSLLESIELFDVYEGENLGKDKKSVAFSLVFRDPNRTLTDEEVTTLHQKLIASMEKCFDAKLR